MPQLAWRNSSGDDRQNLQQFECAERVKRLGRTVYPRPWERQVECAVRTVNPNCDDRTAVLLGTDSDGIAAVVSVGLRTAPSEFMIELVAVAYRRRFEGGQIADEAIEEAVQWTINRTDAAEATELVIVAEIDPRNRASGKLLRRNNFVLFTKTDAVESWIYEPAALPML